MEKTKGLTLTDDGVCWIVRSRSLEMQYFGIFMIFIGLSVLVPLLFVILGWGMPELLVVALGMFAMPEVAGWAIAFLLIRDGRYMKLDRVDHSITVVCGIPVISVLSRDKRYVFSDVNGLTLREMPTRSGKVWFLYLEKKEGKPVRILGPVEDEEKARSLMGTVNDFIRKN